MGVGEAVKFSFLKASVPNAETKKLVGVTSIMIPVLWRVIDKLQHSVRFYPWESRWVTAFCQILSR